MDNQLLINWIIMIVLALGADIAAYIFLRLDWKKNGSTFIDRFWNWLFDKLNLFVAALKKRVALGLIQYHRASVATPAPEPAPLPVGPPVETVPVSVKHIGPIRRIKFSLDMPLDTQVEVRIGATREAGVTVEKREL